MFLKINTIPHVWNPSIQNFVHLRVHLSTGFSSSRQPVPDFRQTISNSMKYLYSYFVPKGHKYVVQVSDMFFLAHSSEQKSCE